MTVLVRNWGGYLLDEDDAEGNWGQQLFDGSCSLHYRWPHWTGICPSEWATYKIRPLHKFEIVCQHLFPIFNPGIRHSVDRIIDTLIEQLLLRAGGTSMRRGSACQSGRVYQNLAKYIIEEYIMEEYIMAGCIMAEYQQQAPGASEYF